MPHKVKSKSMRPFDHFRFLDTIEYVLSKGKTIGRKYFLNVDFLKKKKV